MDPETAPQMYRIAHEALGNAIHHSEGTDVCVLLQREEGRLVMAIQDDGPGLPGNIDDVNGIGIRSMQYRADLIGRSIDFASPDEGGTTVRFELPLE